MGVADVLRERIARLAFFGETRRGNYQKLVDARPTQANFRTMRV